MTIGLWLVVVLFVLQFSIAGFRFYEGSQMMALIYAFYAASNVGFLLIGLGYK